jgi:hypothetical protein
MHYLLGSLASTETGRQWVAMRSTLPDRARKLAVLEAGPDGDFNQPVAVGEAYAGPLELACRDGVWGDWKPDGSALVTSTDTELVWNEEGVLRLSGSLLGSPPRFSLLHAEIPFAWTPRWFAVTGTMDGEAVAGQVLFATVHLPVGQPLVPSPYTSEYQLAWCEFANEFEDGTAECGLLLWGREGFAGVCVQRSDGSVLATSELSAELEIDDADVAFPAAVRFTASGETFVWEALPKGGRWPLRPDVAEDYRLIQGTVRREGERRPVRRASAFVEAYPDRF